MDVPETRYARTTDGISIAYHTVGDGPIDFVWLHAFMGSLEVVWEHELMRSLTTKLATFARVIRHDMRATGLSGRAAELPDLETQAQDLLAVLDDAGSRSTVIFGAGPGAHLASLFAATFPERTRALVVWDFYAWTGDAFHPRDLDLLGRTWGTEAAAAAAMAQVAPSLIADREFLRWYAKVQRHFVPPDGAADLIRSAIETDIRPVLPAIHVPTLVLARGWPNAEKDREIGALIEGSTFVLLPGTERATFSGNQDDMVEAIRDFVGAGPVATPSETLLRAVLFTDIVGSTEHLAKVGDAAWRELLAQHDARARGLIEAHGGRFVKSTGDGVLASFEGPAQAVRVAGAIGPAVEDLGVAVRAGVHVGEVESVNGDVIGVTVNVAARVAALAEASQVLVSSTVKDLVAGSGLVFEDAGEHELKGVPDRWHLYRVVSG
ncbi:MAG TPA: adenylate/guanylate cyclase domain-containing protein [Actinomycetota bacterium]|nr:adenylate/guanylate cyclase domain-containing protein [Actinomycetota bacterium]